MEFFTTSQPRWVKSESGLLTGSSEKEYSLKTTAGGTCELYFLKNDAALKVMAASSRENKVSPTQTNPHITMHKHWMIEHTSIQPSSSFNTSRFFEGKLIQDLLTILWMKNWRVSSFIKTIKTCLIHLAYFMNRIWWRWDFYDNSTGI